MATNNDINKTSDTISLSATSNQLIFNGNTNSTTITVGNPSANRTITIGDPGGSANVLLFNGTQNSGNIITFATATGNTLNSGVNIDGSGNIRSANSITFNGAGTANQVVFGTSPNATTLTCPTAGANRTYTISDFGGSSTFVLTNNTTTTIKTGTWTPTIGDGTNNFTMTTQLGYYSQIGDTCFITAVIVWSSKASASGTVTLSLPFASFSDSTNYRGSFSFSYNSGLVWTQSGIDTALILGLSNGGSSALDPLWIGSNAGTGTLTTANALTAGEVVYGGFYRTA